MFEGKLTGAAAVLPLDVAKVGREELRAVNWSDLVARFDAARELRAELGAGETVGDGSFDPDSARHIAALSGDQPDINFDALANGKAAEGNARFDKNGAAGGDPRI